MLQLCAKSNGISSLSFVSSHLRNDKAFMLEAIKVISSSPTQDSNVNVKGRNKLRPSARKAGSTSGSNQVSRYASQRLQNDHDVVLAAVKKSGLNLKYASYNLRRDYTIAMTAIEENGEAFRYCLPGEVKDRLLSDRNLVLNHIMKNAANHTILRICLDRFKTDQEILLEALASGIDWSLVPWNLQDSRQFVKNAVMRSPGLT